MAQPASTNPSAAGASTDSSVVQNNAQPDSPPAQQPLLSPSLQRRVLLATASVAAFVICWWAGRLVGFPAYRRFDASVLLQPNWLFAVIIVAASFAICALLGTLIAGRVRPDAGIFAACIGWAAFSARGGPMRTLLHDVTSPLVFLRLVLEMIFLTIVAAGISSAILSRRRSRELEEAVESELEHQEISNAYRIAAIIFQTVIMAIVVMILAQTDAKMQAMLAVGIGAFAATALAGEAFDVKRMDFWYFSGPTIVACVGYLLAFFSPEGFAQGYTDQPLARALPLDYASAGFAGAILGSWIGEKHPLGVIEQVIGALTGEHPHSKTHKPAPPTSPSTARRAGSR